MKQTATERTRVTGRPLVRVAGGLLLVASAAGAAVAFMPRAPHVRVTLSATARMADADRFIDSVRSAAARASSTADVSLEGAVALGYAERLRLGMGSPFRLADFALQDPRLTPRTRARTAWSLLDAARLGNTHVVDPRALATVITLRGGDPARHLALAERELASGDPRAGELALRLAYQLAAAERIVSRAALPVMAQAAALVRDRELGRRDVARLFEAAVAEGADPLAMIPQWRADRRFASERPATEGQDAAIERAALPRVPALLDSVRAIASGADTAHAALPHHSHTPLLPRFAAERLAGGASYLPPQGPVVVALRTHREMLGDHMPRTAAARRWVASLSERVAHDEALAAEHARTVWSGVHNGVVSRVALAAAAGMRAYAQESPWFPGSPGPTNAELQRAYGFSEVRFARDVPPAWRPYFRRMLASAAADLRRVVPAARFDGLRVRVEVTSATAPLAVHDPGTRTLRLPVASAAGVLAHELAHDLDWQAARRLYARRAGYGTDYAVRARQDRIAESVQGLTTARLIPPTEENGFRPPHDRRPAEVFARNFDWFVAVSLAREGRVNGYLSAVQDEVLTGYATVSSREAAGRGAESLVRLLGDMAFVPAPTRDWFLEQWGPTRTLRSYALVRELTAMPIGRGSLRDPGAALYAESGAATVTLPPAEWGDSGACGGQLVASAERPQLALARLAADARARGILRSAAGRISAGSRPAWARSALGVAPWSPEVGDRAARGLRDAILRQVALQGVLDSPFTTAGSDCS